MIKPVSGQGINPFAANLPASKPVDPFRPQAQINLDRKAFATPPNNLIVPSTGVSTAPAPNLFPSLVEQVNKLDVFFSDQSFRAQLYRYLNVLPQSQWMAMYNKQSQFDMLNWLFEPAQPVLLITPVFEDDEKKQDQQASDDTDDKEERERQENEAETQEIYDLLSQPSASTFKSESSDVTATALLEKPSDITTIIHPNSDIKKPTKLVLQQLYGHPIQELALLKLAEIYEAAKSNPEQCLWVRQFENEIKSLGADITNHAGVQQVKRPILEAFMNKFYPLALRYLNCQEVSDHLLLPNGAMLPLMPNEWKDTASKKSATVYKVKRLPNGSWFKVKSIHKQVDIDPNDTTKIKKTMEDWNQSLENSGWLRDIQGGKSLGKAS